MTPHLFQSKAGPTLPGVSIETSRTLHAALLSEYGLRPSQVAEAASYSFAMVIRYALGLSAAGGKVCGVVTDTLNGWIVLATIRHLVTSGADAHLIFFMDPAVHTEEIAEQLKPLEKMGVPMDHWSVFCDGDGVVDLIESCHNVLCGLYRSSQLPDDNERTFLKILNELSIPVHTVEAPPGVDGDSGRGADYALFASSTLSLGVPLTGLHAGKDFVGRHYVCDVSFPQALLQLHGLAFPPLFSDQPVVQLTPLEEKSNMSSGEAN